MPLQRRAAPRAEIMGWDGSKWQKLLVQSATYPNLRVSLYESGSLASVTTPSDDARSQYIMGLWQLATKHGFNETGWDRWRNNTEAAILASGTRTVTGNSSDQRNYNARGITLFIDVTAVSGTSPTLDIYVQGKDPVTGKYFNIAKSVTITSVQATGLIVYPGVTDVFAMVDAENDVPLPRTWRIRYVIGGTNPSFTFSVGGMYIV